MKVREALEKVLLEDRSATGVRDAKLLAPKIERALEALEDGYRRGGLHDGWVIETFVAAMVEGKDDV